MLAKLGTLVVVGALTAAGILVIRQQRLVAMHEMARSVERSAEMDRKLWRVRADIAARITPANVRTMLAGMGPLEPIPMYWCPPAATEQMKSPEAIGDTESETHQAAHRPAPKSPARSNANTGNSRHGR